MENDMSVPYSGLRTFMKSPRIEDAQNRFTIIGCPYDLWTTYRSGSRMGPSSIREASLMLTDGDHPRCGIDPVKFNMISDAGDVEVEVGEFNHLEIVEKELSKYNFPIMLGGDHSLTLAGLRAAYKKHGKLSVIHFDAHLDTWDGPHNHGTFMREAINEGLVDPKRTIQLGIRSPAPNEVWDWTKNQGVQIIPSHEVHKENIYHTINRIYDILNSTVSGEKLPVYVTFDIDCITPSECPGTGTPEIGGLFTWQIQEIFNSLFSNTSLKYVGFDMMEVSPPYDSQDITSLTAATLIWSFISYQTKLMVNS